MLDKPVGHTNYGIRGLGFADSDKVNHQYVCFVTYSSETAVPPLYPEKFDQTLSVAHNKSSIFPVCITLFNLSISSLACCCCCCNILFL